MKLKQINSQKDILEIVKEIGFLPFFENEIEGFSIEENISPEYWFDGETGGAWEWKEVLAGSGECVCGHLSALLPEADEKQILRLIG